MKKLLILLLCLSLTAASFIGCDSDGKKLKDKEFSSSDTSAETTNEETTTEFIESESKITIASVDENTTDTESEETEKETFKLPDDAPYSIKKIGNQSYLIFDYDESLKDKPVYDVIDMPLEYSSLDELRKIVTSGKLDVEQLEEFLVKQFPRDENGFKIIDFNEDLYYPAYLPDGWTIRGNLGTPNDVTWYGSSYAFTLRYNEEWSMSTVEIYTKESYAEYCEKCGPSENARTIQKDGKKIIVDVKHFTTAYSTTYYSLELFMEENDTYSVWYLDDLDEIPGDDYLLSFGLDKYVAPAN